MSIEKFLGITGITEITWDDRSGIVTVMEIVVISSRPSSRIEG